MPSYDVAVIGAGASGLVAAISAARRGRSVVILERMNRPGKKLLASGNGRCNLLNRDLTARHYNPEARACVETVFRLFGRDAIAGFFGELGLTLRAEGDRFFPATNQAQSVLAVLLLELTRLGIVLKTDFPVSALTRTGTVWSAATHSGATVRAGAVVVAGGGRTYPALGSDGSAYQLARHLGHTVVPPVPVAVPLTVADRRCHALQGQRIAATVRALVGGKAVREAAGDVLFTAYGFSGTAVIDVSEPLSIAFHRLCRKDLAIAIDLVPFARTEDLARELARRRKGGFPPGALLTGILPEKFNHALRELTAKDPAVVAAALKSMRFAVTGTRGWNEADFTAGGVDLDEIDPKTLASRRHPSLYCVGELLNVNGERGGYNLAWAWASGCLAGQSA